MPTTFVAPEKDEMFPANLPFEIRLELGLMKFFAPLINLLNLVDAIGGGIWLACLGEWQAIGVGILCLCFSQFWIGQAMLLGLFLGAITLAGEKSKNQAMVNLGMILSLAYPYTVAALWSACVFTWFVSHTHPASIIPACLWSYAAATAPWTYLASKERENFANCMSAAFFIQLANICLMVGFGFFHIGFGQAVLISMSLLALSMPLRLRITKIEIAEAKTYEFE